MYVFMSCVVLQSLFHFFCVPGLHHLLPVFFISHALSLYIQSYKQARGEMTNRVLYVDGTYEVLDHKILQFWMQAKQLGSNLVVGVTYSSTETSHTNDMILNACAVNAVDCVIAEAPRHLDVKFLTKFGIDYVVVCPALKNNKFGFFLSDEIYENQKVITVDDNGVAYPLLSKNALKAD
jgi:glycerol-3-phosphate cytidylyltransferase-like family protein